jgi:FMN-binding protein/4Fe-4S binding protein
MILNFDSILRFLAVFTILAAWFIGHGRNRSDLQACLFRTLPQSCRFEKIDGEIYAAYSGGSPEELIGYVAAGAAGGYSGPMKAAVAVDLEGHVLGVQIFEQRETPAWYQRVMGSGFVESLTGKSYLKLSPAGADVDAVTGATYTTRAIAEAVSEASRLIAVDHLKLRPPPLPELRVRFGVPEILLIALFVIGYAGQRSRFPNRKQVRWLTMLTGMATLGFLYNSPLTLAYINKFLLGFWPQWQTHLYWYLLLGGVLLVITVGNQNTYCLWFCPFGAAQECAGLVGGAKPCSTERYRNLLKRFRQGLVWLAIVIALIFRSPGLTSYEVFGTFFDLIGSQWQFLLLGIVLAAAMFIKRPWCQYLCPVPPVVGVVRAARKGVINLWKKRKPESHPARVRS